MGGPGQEEREGQQILATADTDVIPDRRLELRSPSLACAPPARGLSHCILPATVNGASRDQEMARCTAGRR